MPESHVDELIALAEESVRKIKLDRAIIRAVYKILSHCPEPAGGPNMGICTLDRREGA